MANDPTTVTGIRLGLDLTRHRDCLGMVEETGVYSLVGRDVTPWTDD